MSPTTKPAADERPVKHLSFSLSGEQFAIPLLMVKEVIGLCQPTPVPSAPAYFKGFINLRGQVIPIIDLRLKLKMPNAGVGPETSIIILDLPRFSLGVIIDSVDSVLALAPRDISRAPELGATVAQSSLSGVARLGQKLILILDIAASLNLDDLKIIKGQAESAA